MKIINTENRCLFLLVIFNLASFLFFDSKGSHGHVQNQTDKVGQVTQVVKWNTKLLDVGTALTGMFRACHFARFSAVVNINIFKMADSILVYGSSISAANMHCMI